MRATRLLPLKFSLAGLLSGCGTPIVSPPDLSEPPVDAEAEWPDAVKVLGGDATLGTQAPARGDASVASVCESGETSGTGAASSDASPGALRSTLEDSGPDAGALRAADAANSIKACAADAGGSVGPDAAPTVDAAHPGATDASAVLAEAGAREAAADLDCAHARACVHASAPDDGACVERASRSARAEVEAVLACERGACSASCATGRDPCDHCLLARCALAFVTCLRASGCGDGVLDRETEACDDGNATATDICTNACTQAACGDGVTWVGHEACDDGNGSDTDGCLTDCTLASSAEGGPGEPEEGGPGGQGADEDAGPEPTGCGDGEVSQNEACDDGNADPFDSCSGCQLAADHLLITEIVVRPGGAEMVEIFNPSAFSVDLSDYALSDSARYYEVADGTFSTASGSDFAARFPAGSLIASGAYITVAIANASGGSASFFAAYGKRPDLELRPTANGAADDPDVPNLVPMLTTSTIGSNAGLTDGGEPIVLFRARAGRPVEDVDYVFFGTSTTSNPRVDKSGLVSLGVAFAPDTPADAQSTVPSPPEGASLHRCRYSEAGETRTQGNGISGHDETSEPWKDTFVVGGKTPADRTPGGPPPAGLCGSP